MNQPIKIHYLQHVPFEYPANILSWAEGQGHSLTKTLLYESTKLANVHDFDWLVVMGGPMNIYEYEQYPWLIEEKKFIEKAIKANKFVLGICLGAQLIADVLGAKVTKGEHKEIGWFPITLTDEAKESDLFNTLPNDLTVFHWHGDTFAIPTGAKLIVSSEACLNQGFIYDDRVIGFQFHLESSYESAKRLIDNCRNELVDGKYIQSEREILNNQSRFEELESYLQTFLTSCKAQYDA